MQFYDVFLKNKEDNGVLEGWKQHRPAPSRWSSVGSDLDAPPLDPPTTDLVDGSSDGEEEQVEKPHEVKVREG